MIEKEGKLGQILSLMPESDWEGLDLFLQSPYFNRSKPIRELFECYQTAWLGKDSMPEDETLHRQIFPEHDFDPIRIKNLRAALQRKVDQFLSQSAFDCDSILQANLHLKKLNLLGETRHFHRYLERARQDARSISTDHAQLELALFRLEEEQEAALAHSQDRSKQVMDSSESFEHAWTFFQIVTLKELISKSNQKAILGRGELPTKALEILPAIPLSGDNLAVVQLHRVLLELYLKPEEKEILQEYIRLLFESGGELPPNDALFLFGGAVNHCTRWINRGEIGFWKEIHSLFKEMDRLNLFFLNRGVTAAGLKNMAVVGIRMQDFDWVNHLIERYANNLPDDAFGNTESFIRGMLHISRGENDEAERYFHRILDHSGDVFYGLDARSFLLRIYYESGNIVGLESLTESFKMYVKRNKAIAPAHKTSYIQTTKFFKQLVQIQPWDKKGLEKLKAAIARTPVFTSTQQWLLNKVDALIRAT